jgi:hypothetical protein
MTLKIKPHAVDQDSGTFIFPSVLVTDSIITGSVTVFDESVLMGQADAFNFAGDNVEAVISGTTAHIMVTGTAGGGGGHETGTMVIYDEGDWLGVFEEMRFIGDGVNAYNSGSYVAVSIPSGGASGGGTSVTVTTGTFYTEEVLYEIEVASATGTVIADGLSQDYDHLYINILGRSTHSAESDVIKIYFNGDTTDANYSTAYDQGGSGVGNSRGDNAAIGSLAAANAPSDSAGIIKVQIQQYADTTFNKEALSEIGWRASSILQYLRQRTLEWESTAAINEVRLQLTNGTFDVGTKIQIVGVKETVLVTSVEGGGLSGGTPVSVTTGTFYIETLLEEVYLESTTGSIIMPGISQEYDHLRIIGSLRGSESAESTNVNILFNGDTTEANYKTARHIGGNAHTSDVGDWPIMGACPAATATAGEFGSFESFISDYTNPTKKAGANTLTGQRSSAGTSYDHQHRTTWESDAAINRIDIDPRLTDGFVSGTWVQLFGLREETVVTSVEGGGGHLTGTVVVYDEGDFLGVFEEMRFIGDGVNAYNSGSYVAVAITGSAASIDVYDDGVFAVSAEGISFDEGLDVTATGSFAYVKHTQVGVRVRRSTTQTISNASETVVVFNTEVYDYGDMWNSSSGSVLIAPVDGIYDIGLAVQFVQNSTGNRQAKIYINGSTLILAFGQLAENYPWRRTFAVQYALDAGDYVSAAVFQNSGGDLDLAVSNPAYPAFWMALVVPL